MKKIIGPSGKEWPLEFVLAGVGEGWRVIVSLLIHDLFEMGWDGELHQIKEKFGGLRFYIGGGSDEIHKRIQEAESDSLKTCERCGRPGKQRNAGWIRTLCEAHEASDRVHEFIDRENFGGPRRDSLPSSGVSDSDEVVP